MEEVLYLSMLFVALSLVITIFALSRQRSDDGSVKLPPGSFGWPIMGETIEFLFGKPEKFIGDRMKKYSPDIFKTNILGEKTAVICGPNGNKFLFSNENTLFTISQPHPMDKLFGSYKAANTTLSPPPGANTTPSPPLVKGADEVKLIRAPGFFKPEALMRYLPHMDLITQQQLHIHWEGKGYSTDHPLVDMKPPQLVEVFPLSKTVTLMMACRLFLGIDNPERIAIFVRHFDDITLGLHSIVLNFPGTIFYRANKAAIAIRKELVTVIKEKKAAMACTSIGEEPMQYLDILSHMIIATDTTGKYMPEAEIADKMMGLIIAGYSTVATTITFFMKYVGECPHIYNKVLSEQLEISRTKNPGEFLDWNDLSKMKYSWNVMCEVMRLVPPLQGTFREVLCDFTYAGYNIPKGWKVYWTVSTTNKNPQYFRDPEIFNPSRYEEGEARIPYTYMPFGGGPRLCPGNEYARLAVLTFIHNVVKRFKWEVVNPNEKVLGAMMPTPEKGLPIRLYCH